MKTKPLLLALLISLPAFAETDRLSMEDAKEKAKQTGAEAKRATKNAALTGKVKSALAADVGLKTVKIDVDSAEGVVTLKGRVDSLDTKRRAEATAKKVSGVTEVRNQLDAKN
ncbi:MAG: hyperosmotically inducible periplasmic protein [Betaproteobacteria bacterium]|jgi:osmotically-inducible protein OsmY|nr:hyperosmotically inducible periplasmic protein [Betaproteobacteria bacterium]